MDTPRQTGENDLERSLREYVDQLPDLAPEKRSRVLEMALKLHDRQLPTPFIFASIRSTASILDELERDGDVIRGVLTSAQPTRPTAIVTILPFEPGEPL